MYMCRKCISYNLTYLIYIFILLNRIILTVLLIDTIFHIFLEMRTIVIFLVVLGVVALTDAKRGGGKGGGRNPFRKLLKQFRLYDMVKHRRIVGPT